MTYRIIKATEKSGQERYYIQKRVLGLFWAYLDICDSPLTRYSKRVFYSHVDAEKHLKYLIYRANSRKQEKIVKREVVK